MKKHDIYVKNHVNMDFFLYLCARYLRMCAI